jgi:hypothetical protein
MSDSKLEQIYFQAIALVDELLGKDARAVEIAPILVKTGLEIYKTILNEEEYQKIVDHIYDNRNEIQPLGEQVTELH